MTDLHSTHSRLDRWLSVAAGVGALCAVAISLYQAALAREQQRASAWPYLSQSNTFVPGQPYKRQVDNQGVGPARVRQFRVLIDERPVTTWNEAVEALTGAPSPDLIYSSFGRGSVVPPGSVRTLLQLPAGPQAGRFWQEAQTRLETVICYCSIYDECWRADTRLDEPEQVESCPYDAATEFRQ